MKVDLNAEQIDLLVSCIMSASEESYIYKDKAIPLLHALLGQVEGDKEAAGLLDVQVVQLEEVRAKHGPFELMEPSRVAALTRHIFPDASHIAGVPVR